MWNRQKEFNKNFVDYKNLSIGDKQKFTKDYVLYMHSELSEMLREINYKCHRNEKDIIESNVKEEWIDIFKYWLSIGLLWDWNPETFIGEFERKSEVVEQRYIQEKQLDLVNKDRCIAVDIDGVLANYPISFQNFIMKKENVWVDLKGYDLYEQYAGVLGRERMIELKHEYRDSGEKRNIPVCDGAKEFLDHFYDEAYTIILLTSRPYKKYSRIFADTIEWLKKNDLKYHAIIWDEEKNYEAIKQFPKIEFMVEDHPRFAINIAKLGYRVYLVDRPYNQGVENTHEKIDRVKSVKDIIEFYPFEEDMIHAPMLHEKAPEWECPENV